MLVRDTVRRPRVRHSPRAALSALAGLAVCGLSSTRAARAQDGAASRIPLERGLTLVQTLHGTGADRESLVIVDGASSEGVRYVWRAVEVHERGDTVRWEYQRRVSAADLARAAQLHVYFDPSGPQDHPGYTTFSLSTALYERLRAEGAAPISIMSSESPLAATGAVAGIGIGVGRAVPVRWRGTLTRASAAPEPFPLIVDGRRVTVPALHVRGRLAARERVWDVEMWALADAAHPLLLRTVKGDEVFQTVRVERPGAERAAAASLERALAADCRAELPGIYFGFDSALLDPASEAAIAATARVLARHADWTATLEGHTDSLGTAAANQDLSRRRADAVRARLTTYPGIAAAALRAVGYGASRPRESNATVEGRARNRRVELVRQCAGRAG